MKGSFSEHYERHESSSTIDQQNKKQKFEEKNREKIQMFNVQYLEQYYIFKINNRKNFFLINHNTV